MDFGHSVAVADLMERMTAFLNEHIVPAESACKAELTGGDDWRKWVQPPTMEALKAKAKAAGLVPLHPHIHDSALHSSSSSSERARQQRTCTRPQPTCESSI